MAEKPSEAAKSDTALVMIHRRAVRLKRSKSGQVPRPMSEELVKTAGMLAKGERAANLGPCRGRPGYDRVKVTNPQDRALVKWVERLLMVHLVRERADFYDVVRRLPTRINSTDFSPLQRKDAPESSDRTTEAKSAGGYRGARTSSPWAPFTDDQLLAIPGCTPEHLSVIRELGSLDQVLDPPAAGHLGDDLALRLEAIGGDPSTYGQIAAGDDSPINPTDEQLKEALEAGTFDDDFVVPVDQDELTRILGGSMEEWMVFIHSSQRRVVERQYNGPALVSGGPGTGKTVVALHRAIELARRAGDGQKVLLTTYVKTLPQSGWKLFASRNPIPFPRT